MRQFRASLANQTALEPDRQLALGQTLWQVVGGGRPYRRSLVPDRVVLKVIERQKGRCEKCGAPAIDVDHTGSG